MNCIKIIQFPPGGFKIWRVRHLFVFRATPLKLCLYHKNDSRSYFGTFESRTHEQKLHPTEAMNTTWTKQAPEQNPGVLHTLGNQEQTQHHQQYQTDNDHGHRMQTTQNNALNSESGCCPPCSYQVLPLSCAWGLVVIVQAQYKWTPLICLLSSHL